MSALKRPFGDISSTAPDGAVGLAKRTVSSRNSFLRSILNDEFNDENAEETTNEVSESVSKASSSSVVNASPSECRPGAVQIPPKCSPSSCEICYGMLLDGTFKPFRNCGQPESWVAEDRTQPAHIAFGLRSWRADSMTVLSPDSQEIGVLDKRMATVLMLLKKVSGSIRFSLFLGNEGDQMRHTLKERWPKTILPLDIIIQGPIQNLEEVGEVLSDAGMFLQEPSFLEPGVIYRNPHFLSWDEQTATPLLSRRGESSRNDFTDSVAEVMNCSNPALDPPKLVQDRRVMTALKRHQIDALNFMLARENQFENALTLWEPIYVNYRKAFKHRITREIRSSRPRECLGGILADEMGMGKSLALLALVVHTLGDANLSSQGQEVSYSRVGTGKPSSRTTLIITPKSTLYNWELEIKRHMSPELRWSFYHGRGKHLEPHELVELDIVCTTYETVFHDTNRLATLQAVPWFRVVLDEAHHIRNRTKCFRAVMNLRAERKWCLTGTPVQNSLEDLFSLTEYLGFHPVENRLNARRWILEPLGARDENPSRI